MTQIAAIKPPNFESIAAQFKALDLSYFEATFTQPSLPNPTDVLSGSFVEPVTSLVETFSTLAATLPTDPTDLLEDLTGKVSALGNGSVDIANLLTDLTAPFTQASTAFSHFQTILTPLTEDLLPALSNLQTQPTDGTTLTQLFPIAELAQPLTGQLAAALAPQLTQVQAIAAHITDWIPQSAERSPENILLSDYESLLSELATLPLDASLNADHLSLLSEEQTQPLQQQIDTLQGKVQTVTENLSTFQQNLADTPATLNAAIDDILNKLSPQYLAQLKNPLTQALAALTNLEELDLSSAIAQVQSAVIPLQTLVENGVETATSGLETVVSSVETAITTAEQALVKVSALITDLIEKLIGFIQQIDLTSVINQAKDVFQGVILKLNGILNQVGGFIEQIYTFVRSLIDKATALGKTLPALADKLRQALSQVTAFLSNPQVKDAVAQAKSGLDLVIQKLDAVSLNVVFDQVSAQATTVKTSLQAIDLSQLNQLLKTALSQILNVIRNEISPPSKVTDEVIKQYNAQISEPVLVGIIQPVKQQVASINDLIHQLAPGSLVGDVLSPLYEEARASIQRFVDPDQVSELLQPVTDFHGAMLTKLDEVLNPQTLLQPLVGFYQQIMDFVRSLTPETLIDPLNALLDTAKQPLESLNLEKIVTDVTDAVSRVTNWIKTLRIDDSFLDGILADGISPVIQTWLNKLQATVTQMDLSGVTSLLQPLRTAADTLVDQTRLGSTAPLAVVHTIQNVVTTIQQYAAQYEKQLGRLASTWQAQRDRLNDFTPAAPALRSDYTLLKQRLASLNPVALLSTTTALIDQLSAIATTLLATLTTVWQGLSNRLQTGKALLDRLLNDGADGLKAYINQAIDALVEEPLQILIQSIDKPLAQLKEVIREILKLQNSLDVFDLIPQSIQRIGDAVVGLKDKIIGFNVSFLAQPLERVLKEVEQPLAALNPQATLMMPLTQVYHKILKMLDKLNPVHLFATARGTITLKVPAGFANVPMHLPLGTRLVATTPLGEKIWFETLLESTFSGDASSGDASSGNPGIDTSLEVPIRALVTGRSSDIVGIEGVSWQVVAYPDLEASHTQPLLSLVTLVQEELLGILSVFDPIKLIVEPLNEQYDNIVQLFDDLGIGRLFDTFFQKIEAIDQEISSGLARVGGDFVGLVAAMPL